MPRYGANELFNPGSGRRKKKSGTGVTTGSSSGSLGPMPHSQAPDALAMLTSALDLGEKVFKGDTKTDTKKENGNGFKKDSIKDDGMDLNLRKKKKVNPSLDLYKP